MQSLTRTQLYIIGGLAAAVIMLAISIVTVALVVNGQTKEKTQSSQSDGDSDFKTSVVSSLSGGVSSYSNLKGLTLRINQIDTCNPKQVSAYISVSAESGDVRKNFGKDDVKLYLDGKRVTNFQFNAVDTTKLPLANMLVIDRSGSMAGAAIDNAKAAAISYVDKLKPADQVGVIQFDQSVSTLVAMTTDKAQAKQAISGIQVGGDTAVYDALEAGIAGVPNCGRKAVTVLSDGDDRMSSATEQSVIQKANQMTLPIFSVGIKGEGFNSASIRSISDKTGGQYLEANTPQEIADIYSKIDSQLTGQFATNFSLSVPKNGSSHTLKIVTSIEGSDTSSERTFVY